MAKEKTPRPEYERRLGLWIDALESIKFSQGKGCLRELGGGKYCCLGVACEIYRRETGDGEWVFATFKPEGRPRISGVLPSVVADYYGLRDASGTFKDKDTVNTVLKRQYLHSNCEVSLTDLNDGVYYDGRQSLPFTQIAAVIKARPKGLFTWTKDEEANG